MIIIDDYFIAIALTVLAMICWGSWANTQKMAQKKWRFELYYWDKISGIVLLAVLAAFTFGSLGSEGRTFVTDIQQADNGSIINAVLGGILWNAGNLLLVAAIAEAGMSVAFPIGAGIAWILGIAVNYYVVVSAGKIPTNNPLLLWLGVALIIVAIVISGRAYSNLAKEQKKTSIRGIVLSVFGGLFIAFFYGFVVKSLDSSFVDGGTGSFTPFTAIVFFSMGVIICTTIFFLFLMRPLKIGNPGSVSEFFSASWKNHIAGITGGIIWCLGMVFSFMAVGAASPAISYALSNAAPVVAILWGVFVWKEFKNAPKGTGTLLTTMFLLYIFGLLLVTISNA